MRACADFRALKARVSIAQFLAARGLLGTLRPRGRRLMGPCPIHGGDNPTAFVVDTARNSWRCFTHCQRGGDVVELVRALDRIGYRDAGLALAHIAATPVPEAPSAQTHRPRAFAPYTRALPLDHHTSFLRDKQIHPATARHFEAGAYRGRGFLAGCVGVRLFDPAGRPLGYAGRRLDPGEVVRLGKWKFPPGLPKASLLYGYHLVPARAPIVVVECPWSVMRLVQLDIPAVALLGVHLSEPQLDLLADIERIVLLLDGDVAGRAATMRISRRLARTARSVVTVDLPDGLDPDDLPDEELRATLHAR